MLQIAPKQHKRRRKESNAKKMLNLNSKDVQTDNDAVCASRHHKSQRHDARASCSVCASTPSNRDRSGGGGSRGEVSQLFSSELGELL